MMFIYRDEYYNRDSERPGEADVIIAKHRNGPVGDVDAHVPVALSRSSRTSHRDHAAEVPGDAAIDGSG